jgi:hypothetical protein
VPPSGRAAGSGNCSVVGAMNAFAFLDEGYRENVETSDLLVTTTRLAGSRRSESRFNRLVWLIKGFAGTPAHRA